MFTLASKLFMKSRSETNLSNIAFIKDHFNGTVGHSDHTGNKNALLAATILGARILEFHVAWDKSQFGPDSTSSILINSLSDLIKNIKDFEEIKNSLNKKDTKNGALINRGSNEKIDNKIRFGKSITARNNINIDKPIGFQDLESTKPADIGINASEYESIIGKFVKHTKNKGEFISKKDIVW